MSTATELAAVDTPATAVDDDPISAKDRHGQTTVLQRLAGLFPTHPPTSDALSSGRPTAEPGKTINPVQARAAPTKTAVRWDDTVPVSPPPTQPSASIPDALKVRMITWNMHDSLPKGELEELLGKVPAYTGPTCAAGRFPVLSGKEHPYHFVVVAGQECPSSSGIPMALGAGIKQLIVTDKEKEKERDKDRDRGSTSPKDATDKNSELDAAAARLREQEREIEQAILRSKTEETAEGPPVGWTSTVSDWLCSGGMSRMLRSKSHKASPSLDVNFARPPTKRAVSLKEPIKKVTGPYTLLVKERLLGIYLAIYIHRDLKPLVKGTDKSAVTAGLIGGRVGNKGGVGISINLDGTTLLFLNTHLAAHEGRVSHRLANLEKIKTELKVNDFLSENDPRKNAEDLTDRFDFTFLCGDLNFRLDITRLHADWLISRQDYQQALTFDQLRKLMKAGASEFAGFTEAPISFAPTFKYDVLRTLKRPKCADEENDEFDEGMSMSSMSTSFTRATEADLQSSHHATPQGSPVTPVMPASASKLSLSQIVAANKAKIRLLSLNSPIFRAKRKAAFDEETVPATPSSALGSAWTPIVARRPTPPTPVVTEGGDSDMLVPPPKIQVESMTSKTTGGGSQEDDKGVYDSSSKKRVPSWCDRILWKTTLEISHSPEGSPEPASYEARPPPQKNPKRRLDKFLSPFKHKSSKSARQLVYPDIPKTNVDPKPPHLPPLKSAPPLTQSIFPPLPRVSGTESPVNFPGSRTASMEFHQPPLSTSAAQRRPARRTVSTTAASPPPSAPTQRRSTFGVFISPLSGGHDSAYPSRWRFLPSFLSPHYTPYPTEVEEPATPIATPAVVRRKGDVVCLDYNTLDDRGMRRLEGRSDHRPVMGTFIAYI